MAKLTKTLFRVRLLKEGERGEAQTEILLVEAHDRTEVDQALRGLALAWTIKEARPTTVGELRATAQAWLQG